MFHSSKKSPVKPVELPSNTNSERGVYVSWPKKVLGLYILLADDDHEGYERLLNNSLSLNNSCPIILGSHYFVAD